MWGVHAFPSYSLAAIWADSAEDDPDVVRGAVVDEGDGRADTGEPLPVELGGGHAA